MTAGREILQKLIDAGGTLPRHDFDHTKGYANMVFWLLRDRGLITVECNITEAGRALMEQPPEPRKIGKRRKSCPAQNLLDGFMRFPVASTDDQIEKLKEQAEADRSFGSINQRKVGA